MVYNFYIETFYVREKHSMTIRRANENDIAFLKRLLGQVLEVHAQIRPDIFVSGTCKYTETELLEIINMENKPIFICEDDIPLGYCFCELQENHGHNLTNIKTLYIDDLCVDEKCRGKGVATCLFQYALEYARQMKCHNVTLNVWQGNDVAKAFYEKMGMEILKTTMEIKI